MNLVALLVAAAIYAFFAGEPQTGSDSLFSNSTDVRNFEKWVHERGTHWSGL